MELSKKEIFLKNEELNQMTKEQLIDKCNDYIDILSRFYDAYRIVPGGEYYLHKVEHGKSTFFKIALPKDENAPLKEYFYPDFKQTPAKIIGFAEQFRNLPDKTKIRIKKFKEEVYQKKYDWIYTIKIIDFDIIPDSNLAQEEEQKEKKKFEYSDNEDDYLF